MGADARQEAVALLGCRPEPTAAEVRAAYRRAVRTARPDTGGADGAWLTRVQAARDLLLAGAAPDRRRRPRVAGTPPREQARLRRSTWAVADTPASRVDLHL